MSKSNISYKDIIELEKQRCASDPVYFMKKYVYIQHPTKGRMLFTLYPFQEKVLRLFRDNPYSIVLKSRQLGISTLTCGYSLWLMLFSSDKNILCIANKQDTAKSIVQKVQFAYDNLPSWLTIESSENNKLNLKLINGSRIKAVSAAGDSGRSEAVSLLILDECGFVPRIKEIVTSILPTLSTGGGCIALSTPNGEGNWFADTWHDAVNKKNAYLPIKLKWDVHPERDEHWRKKQDEIIGDLRKAAQECDCEFSTSGETVLHPDTINYLSENTIEAIEKRYDGSLHIFKTVNHNNDYIVCADIARGDGNDYSAFHVIDIVTNEQVASYKDHIGTTQFANLLVSIATEYNNALLAPDNASIGWNTIEVILSKGYQNLYYSPKGEMNDIDKYNEYLQYNKEKLTPGFTISTLTRPKMVSRMIEHLTLRTIKINCKRTIEEFRTFIWLNSKQQAQRGKNDDLIMSLAIGMYLSDSAQSIRQQNGDISKAVLSSIKKGTYTNANPYGSSNFTIDINNSEPEDISWLF